MSHIRFTLTAESETVRFICFLSLFFLNVNERTWLCMCQWKKINFVSASKRISKYESSREEMKPGKNDLILY